MSKVTIPNSETGAWEEKDLSSTMKRSEKEEAYLDFFNRYTARIKKIEDNLSEKEKDDIKSSNRNIEVLAVFVTLFTFVSIETQILRSGISFITAIGFSMIMLGGLLFFLFSLNFFIKNDRNWRDYFQYLFLLVISLGIISTGLFSVYKGEASFYAGLDNKYYQKSEVDQKITTGSTGPLENFKKCILLNGTYWPCLK
jgi:hypothetical protein